MRFVYENFFKVSSTPNDIEISDDEMPSNDENEDDVPKPSRGCGVNKDK